MKFGMRHISRMFLFAIVLSGGMIPASSNPARTPTPSESGVPRNPGDPCGAGVLACVFSVQTKFVPSPPGFLDTPSESAPDAGQAIARVEVRLRKLHLVRPDLIPYPIMYDVYC